MKIRAEIRYNIVCVLRTGRVDPGIRSLGADGFGQKHLPSLTDVAVLFPTAHGHQYQLDVAEGHQNALEVNTDGQLAK